MSPYSPPSSRDHDNDVIIQWGLCGGNLKNKIPLWNASICSTFKAPGGVEPRPSPAILEPWNAVIWRRSHCRNSFFYNRAPSTTSLLRLKDQHPISSIRVCAAMRYTTINKKLALARRNENSWINQW